MLRIVALYAKIDEFVLLDYWKWSKDKVIVNLKVNNAVQVNLIYEFSNENVKTAQLYVYSWPNLEGCYKNTCVASYDLAFDKSSSSDLEQAGNTPVDITKYLTDYMIDVDRW